MYTARITWERGDDVFTDRRYSRRHTIAFDGGVTIPGSASPHVVRAPMSDEAAVDPEEMFVACLANCHMLWFLDLVARERFRVDRYVDEAEGEMERNAEGKLAMTRVTLRPKVEFSGDKIPTPEDVERLHHRAHEECFIASSVKSDVRIEPR
jgi:organic hydroperoxide reductase OsmC/OhrA